TVLGARRSCRTMTDRTAAHNGSLAATIEVRTAPRRRSPANSPRNAPAVHAATPTVDSHWCAVAGALALPVRAAPIARAAPAAPLTHIEPVSESVLTRTALAPVR